MKKVNKVIEVSKNGKNIKFSITAERGVLDHADHAEGFSGNFKTYKHEEVAVYVDGKLFEKGRLHDCRNINIPGFKLPMGAVGKIGNKMMLSAEILDMLVSAQSEVIAEAETDEEYAALNAKESAKKAEAQKKEAARIITAYEAGKCLKSYAAAENYNNIMNEGGEGYVPEVITAEMYAAAKKLL